MYYESRGAIQNYAEALKWYRKSAEQGVALAQLGLGIMYAGGKGVTQDYVAAHMWFSLAAELGNEESSVSDGNHFTISSDFVEEGIPF